MKFNVLVQCVKCSALLCFKVHYSWLRWHGSSADSLYIVSWGLQAIIAWEPAATCRTRHYIASHCTSLHCTALNCTALHCTALHFTALHCTVLYFTTLHYTVLHLTSLDFTARHCTSLDCTSLYCTSPLCTLLNFISLHCIALHYSVLHCTALHCRGNYWVSNWEIAVKLVDSWSHCTALQSLVFSAALHCRLNCICCVIGGI